MKPGGKKFFLLLGLGMVLLLASCLNAPHYGPGLMPPITMRLLPPNVHGRLVNRTMHPQYITIHSTENPGATAENHARYLLNSGDKSRHGKKFNRSGWVAWHFTVDNNEIVEHLLPTEQGDHADYGGLGDRQSIGIEICEFRDPAKQAAAVKLAAQLAAALADKYHIPTSHIVPHMHWPRWDFRYGKPCPRILLERNSNVPGGWYMGPKWRRFIQQVERYR